MGIGDMTKKTTITDPTTGDELQAYRQSDEVLVAKSAEGWSVFHGPSGKWLRGQDGVKGRFKQKREAVEYAAYLMEKLDMNFTTPEGFVTINPNYREFV